jgi:DNA polymerase IV
MSSPSDDAAGLRWLFLDLNSYFASVEQQANPALRGRPVIVIPVDSPFTSAIAASYEARALGIRTGTSVLEARDKCPDIRVVLARHDTYVDYHHRIIREIESHLHVTKVCSIDEVACALMGGERRISNAIELAAAVQRGILRNVGECLTSSVGLAPSRLLAKTASDMKKPRGLTLLALNGLPGPLLDLKLTDIAGIARGIERRLASCGIHTVEAFWNLSPGRARTVWGSIEGERFWYGLHGIDPPEIETQRGSISHSHVLAARLRQAGYKTSALSLGLRLETRVSWGEDMLFPATDNTFALLRHLERLWSGRPVDFAASPIKKVGVVLQKLTPLHGEMQDLFDEEMAQKEDQRELALSKAMDRLNQRYGRGTVLIGPPNRMPQFVGAKIAFNRIPERQDFSN